MPVHAPGRTLGPMRWTVITPAVAMALALTGCGSGPAASVPKSDFIREADAICAKADRDTKAIGPELPLSDVLQRSGAIAANSSADIRALPQPSGSAAQIGRC